MINFQDYMKENRVEENANPEVFEKILGHKLTPLSEAIAEIKTVNI